MPAISASAISTGNVGAAAIYDGNGKTFNPANPADSLEILNGGLDSVNWTGGATIPPWAVQIGANAVGIYEGFDRWEFTYARQIALDASYGADEKDRVLHGGLALTFHLPWTASKVLFGWQAFFRQDATEWDNDNDSAQGQRYEFWDFRTKYDGTVYGGLYGKLPHGRTTISQSDGVDEAGVYTPPGMHAENRWRYVAKMGMVTTGSGLSKGNHFLRISMWAGVFPPDPEIAKCLTPTGGIWILALR